MYDAVHFYTSFHYGDVFESREFVREWMKLVPANKYYYAHNLNPRILLDMPELEHESLTEVMHPTRAVFDDRNGNLFVNTWIGRNSKYVLPGYGCSVEKLYQMHNDMLRIGNFGQLSRQPVDYIPEINYGAYEVRGILKFLTTDDADLILIDNGIVQSSQANNFLFDNVVYQLASEMKDKIFIVTHKIAYQAENIFFTDDITGRPGGFDLNEISFLSTFCRVIIGRSSGAYTFSQVRENIHNSNKKLLAFTYHKLGSSFVVNTQVEIQKYWSSATSEDSVYTNMKEVIND